MISQDLQLDDIGDILLKDGDYVIGESDFQHIEDILDAYPGEYRNAPLLGVYLQRSVNGLMDGSVEKGYKTSPTKRWIHSKKSRDNERKFKHRCRA